MNVMIIGFSKAKSIWALGSKAIQISEKRDFSHAYIQYQCPITNAHLIAQASHGFVNLMTVDIFTQRNIIIEEYSFNLLDQSFQDMLNYINQNLGMPYSKLQIILLSIKKLFKVEINIHNKNDAFICSEFVAKICEILKLIPNIKDQDYLTPSDLNKLIRKNLHG